MDIFRYTVATESSAGTTTRDFINGFIHGTDVIDLAAIDANSVGGGANDAFTFIGSAAFGGAGAASAGQLRFFTFGGGNLNIVEADRNGDWHRRHADLRQSDQLHAGCGFRSLTPPAGRGNRPPSGQITTERTRFPGRPS